MSVWELLFKGDSISSAVALVLLAMSVCSWVVIVWKTWLLRRALADVTRSTAAFWQAPSVADALQVLPAFDRELLVQPLVEATQVHSTGTLAAAGDASQRLTRVLRDALHAVLLKLQWGQVLLATVGSTAPFV
ncbi:MAG: MotA/TolQ/ExbB proton channel family protein, partial [Rhodoferax sp.]